MTALLRMLARRPLGAFHDVGAGADMGGVAARLNVEQLANIPRRRGDLRRLDAGLDAHLVQHMHDVFGRQVADRGNRPGHRNATADAADRALDKGCARIERGVPAITVGITTGANFNETDEWVAVEPMLRGVAQVIGMLLAIEGGCCE